MTTRDVDRLLTTWLEADAPVREPDHLLGDVLARTSHTRRRPGWVVPERWLPMQRTMRFQAAPRLGAVLAVVALLILVLGLAGVFVAGQRRLPPAFGVASNGQVVYVSNGELWAARADGSSAHAITADGLVKGAPLLSHDGSRLAFLAYPAGTLLGGHAGSPSGSGDSITDAPDLIVMQVDGTRPVTIVADAAWIRHVAWSPDDRQIVFSRFWNGATTYQRDRIFVAPVDGSSEPEMVGDALLGAFNPTMSPDGRRIAFVSDHYPDLCGIGDCQGEQSFGLHVMDADGLNGITLAHGQVQPATVGATDAADFDRYARVVDWSPDSRTILFSGLDTSAPRLTGIYAVAADGKSDPTRLTDSGGIAFGAVWSPDGRRIAYLQNDGERWQVVVADPDGRNARPIRDDVAPFGPQWSPDGRSVIVVDPVTGPNATLRVVPVDGGAAERTIAVTIAASGSISELGLEQPSWQRLAP